MTATAVQATNDYWEHVRPHLSNDRFYGGICVDWPLSHGAPKRHEMVSRYSWTVTDPGALKFVTEHCGPRALDPLAGTGWWAHLLTRAGVDVLATDLHPADGQGGNIYHKTAACWLPVVKAAADEAALVYGEGRTLPLSWPPYDEPIGADTLRAYPGDRVIYIGEGEGGCCGDDDLFGLLGAQWTQVAEHRPVQWWGIHDWITVYDRAVAA